MSYQPEFPEQEPLPLEASHPESTPQPALEDSLQALQYEQPTEEPQLPTEAPPLFDTWSQPEPPPEVRIPNPAHLGILAILVVAAAIITGLLTQLAMHFHLFGVSTVEQLANNIPYGIATQVLLYLLVLVLCLIVFPLLWRKGLFAGLQWNGLIAIQQSGKLILAAFGCFILAIIDGILIPSKGDAPIDEVFKAPGGAWLLVAFGITLAPFFEELAFRGFLLPALATAWDWFEEQSNHTPRLPLDLDGHPLWSQRAMIAGSIAASLPFAAMHAAQTGYTLGPFLLLICVSLVLCWVRLSTRSLAASTLVHASYNLILFVLSFVLTDGFKHLDKL
jgi:membrane protease YdiL (CAAX protease family)